MLSRIKKTIRIALRSRVIFIFFYQIVDVNLLLMRILWFLGFVSQQCSRKQHVCTTTPIILIFQIHMGIWDFKIVFISWQDSETLLSGKCVK